jgi:hypothetical protein
MVRFPEKISTTNILIILIVNELISCCVGKFSTLTNNSYSDLGFGNWELGIGNWELGLVNEYTKNG